MLPFWWEMCWDPDQRRACCRSPGHRCLSWTEPGWRTGGFEARRPAQREGWAHTHGSRALQTAACGWWAAWCVPAHTGLYKKGPVDLQECDLEKRIDAKHILLKWEPQCQQGGVFFTHQSCIKLQITLCNLTQTIFVQHVSTSASPCYVTKKLPVHRL